jgi:hypothetical protein
MKGLGKWIFNFLFYSKEAILNIFISSYSYIIEILALDDVYFNDFSNYEDEKYIKSVISLVRSVFSKRQMISIKY